MTTRRLRLAATCLAGALLLGLSSAGSASGAVAWTVMSAHGPQNMPPGGIGQYIVHPFNVGDADTTDPIVVQDALPPGVQATAVYGSGWSAADCTGLGVSGGTVTCTSTQSVHARALTDANLRGAATALVLQVAVDAGASGTADNVVTVSGGGPGAAPGTTTDPTPFSSVPAGFGLVPSSFVADALDGDGPSASPTRQAGAHPFELHVRFDANLKLSSDPEAPQPLYTEPDEHIKDLVTDLPAGLVGNPQALPKCPADLLNSTGPASKGNCPTNTQVGTINLVLQDGKEVQILDPTSDIPVYNMEPPRGAVAAFALSFVGNPVWIIASIDPTDHSVITTVPDQIELFTLRHADLRLWGVPGDPAHDPERFDASQPVQTAMNAHFTAPIRPFLTMPSQCGVAGAINVRADSWTHPGAFTPWMSGASHTMTGCDDHRFRFEPSVSVQPESRRAGAPTGLDVDVTVPQKDDTVTDATQLYAASGDDRAIATPPLRSATVTLPAGMAVSPSSANGLAACSPLQIKLGTNDEPSCPDASKIGSLSIATPLLPDPLTGSVYLATQNQNPFGSMLALYLVAKGPGVIIKLPGKVVPDPVTGQLTTTFDDNPQLPFSTLHIHLFGGAHAALVNPTACGTKTATATLTSWNASLPAVQASDSFPINGDGAGGACAPRRFDPSFTAGSLNPVAGEDSPIVTRFTRGDADDELSTVSVSLPKGLLGRISHVTLCPRAAAQAGTCGPGSRIGTVTVGAGPGSDPFYITDGKAYITGPYKGAPFGLSMVVHAKAGPLDLGNVVVRARIEVDRTTAQLRVVTDPLPRILAGIPLKLRVAQVLVDRPHFTFNPTRCSSLTAAASMTSTGGATARKTERFRVSGCNALPFHPQMSFRLGGKGHIRHGASTPLTTVVRMTPGQANLAGVSVTLPASLNARLEVVTRACTQAQFDAGHCAARAGTATASTPLLRHPLRGGVYFVKDPHRPTGSLPNLVVALRGQVDVDLVGRIRILHNIELATTFAAVPDVPITTFRLHLVAGRDGSIGVVRNLCRISGSGARATVTFRAQNGRVIHTRKVLHVAGCAPRRGVKR